MIPDGQENDLAGYAGLLIVTPTTNSSDYTKEKIRQRKKEVSNSSVILKTYSGSGKSQLASAVLDAFMRSGKNAQAGALVCGFAALSAPTHAG